MLIYKIKILANLGLILLCFFTYGCTPFEANSNSVDIKYLSLDEAQKIAKAEAQKMDCGVDKDETSISYQDEREAWSGLSEMDSNEFKNIVMRLHREKKYYWVFTFAPSGENIFGGSCVVFIDRTNGEVLDFLGYK